MMNKLYLIRQPVRLTCTWVPTGNPRMPLACVWTAAKVQTAIETASSADETGRMRLCA